MIIAFTAIIAGTYRYQEYQSQVIYPDWKVEQILAWEYI
ncbi:hypothetical protein H1P_4990003 [Hyella patelloides LEGE 07179]|uniref:Uncharacterized protein n=1 Tax=Hyella patelloides LEGE 07179 TaxID=945734 RepID=A0A563VZ99_9CYAN|nr:hypothetical protein H1P_4990003 [Hyella patelloides LEGE 07179]